MKNYVIIGNSIAAVGVIEGIRSIDTEGKITVISGEKHPAYCRPLISYYLEKKSKIENMGYRSDDFYEKNAVEVLYGKTAQGIDADKKLITLDDGRTVGYDKLCIATGSSPFVPRFEGWDTVPKKHTFMTIDDALALEKDIDESSRVLIIGAGLIGLKCAEGIKDRVKSITVCDLADRILSSILDEETGAIMQEHIEQNGIEFMLSDTVEKFDGNRAFMKSGKVVDFDVLVAAVGVRPNVALAKDAGAQVARGIIIDDHMRTTAQDIYAAGDCAESYDISFGDRRILAILPNANIQGHTAGKNMAGADESFLNAIPMNSIGLFGLHVMTAGSYFTEKDGGTVFIERTEDGGLKKFFVKDGLLTGYILLSDIRRGGIYTSLIRNQTPLETLDFELLMKDATFAAFTADRRRQMFGGVL